VFVAARGDPFETVVAGVNIGNDADTIATMGGALAGALRGPAQLPAGLVSTLRQANSEDLGEIVEALTAIAWRRVSGRPY
jgi:ADP-ribosylglycohydrolase